MRRKKNPQIVRWNSELIMNTMALRTMSTRSSCGTTTPLNIGDWHSTIRLDTAYTASYDP